ncbi:glycosyl hydrolase 115 family protein [Bifidobacterium sp. 82T10]|uniref:Glycosyl hydrolase 115 family protein n=1 Tax=Bifidobacterium miconis TaxID=2834435 RepID=A0ABS6WFQ9_9BIFI|nr:glycosyl hydrolase 115 family protein [Bifidobacterium miconis]MBW3092895.1 glycosyl hydrolase 115 family protein [Bifidobacterium miconis]
MSETTQLTDTRPFTIYDGRRTAPIVMDAPDADADIEAARGYRQVRRAAGDLRQDIAMADGAIDWRLVESLFVDGPDERDGRLLAADETKVPALLTLAVTDADTNADTDAGSASVDDVDGDATQADDETTDNCIIVGIAGRSPIIDALERAGRLPQLARISGRAEGYVLADVDLDGVDGLAGLAGRALVIAGSDARGTIYGIYDVSRRVGVSPWYWYADVPVEVRERIELSGLRAHPVVETGPDVRYRGIFVNDEEHTRDWARRKYPTEHGTPDVNFYRHIFELLLRLRMNVLWPAMHDCSQAFNLYEDGDGVPVNAREAAEYGVIMSSSHCEIMLRNNVGEWRRWFDAHLDAYDWTGDDWGQAFDYTRHKDAILDYWRERLEKNRGFESILPLGIRGIHDGAFLCADLASTYGTKLDMMRDVIREQRRIIADMYGSEDAVPQVLIPYKEVGELYNAGLRDDVPDDVMLMWAEDNFGNLRQVPDRQERSRSGGSGIYYHISYWGYPKSWLWLDSMQYALMVEQLHRAWNTGAGRYWILNVGDIKPGEVATELFADVAWNVHGTTDRDISRFCYEHARRDFGLPELAARQAGQVLESWSALCGIKRPEFFCLAGSYSGHAPQCKASWEFPFSATAEADEGLRLLERLTAIRQSMSRIRGAIRPQYRSTFFQQVGVHVESYWHVACEYVYYRKACLAARQHRLGSYRAYRALSLKAARNIALVQRRYWDLSDGKWDHALDCDHSDVWNDWSNGIDEGILVLDEAMFPPEPEPLTGIGASCEGARDDGSGLLRFDSMLDAAHYIDVFSRSGDVESWHVETDVPWIRFDMAGWHVDYDECHVSHGSGGGDSRGTAMASASGATSSEQRVVVTVDWHGLGAGDHRGHVTVFAGTGRGGEAAAAVFDVTATVRDVDFDGPSFMEAEGKLVIKADHCSAMIAGGDGTRWQLVRGIGPRGNGMKAVPDTADPVPCGAAGTADVTGIADITDVTGTARLVYHAFFEHTGTMHGSLYRMMTLNEGIDDHGPCQCRLALSVDGGEPVVLAGERQWNGPGWETGIMRQTDRIDFAIDIERPGWHDLVVSRIDPSMCFTHIIIETVPGALADSLIGPVESPNSIVTRKQVYRIPAIPEFGDEAGQRP